MQDEGTGEAEKPQVMNLHRKDTMDITTDNTYTHNTVTYGVCTQITYVMYDTLNMMMFAHL